MTYQESSTLMTNLPFRGRIKVSAIKFADSIMIESPAVPAHNSRMRWAARTFQQPDMIATELQPPVVMDPAIQAAGIEPSTGDSTISDAALQGAVEATANKMI